MFAKYKLTTFQPELNFRVHSTHILVTWNNLTMPHDRASLFVADYTKPSIQKRGARQMNTKKENQPLVFAGAYSFVPVMFHQPSDSQPLHCCLHRFQVCCTLSAPSAKGNALSALRNEKPTVFSCPWVTTLNPEEAELLNNQPPPMSPYHLNNEGEF